MEFVSLYIAVLQKTSRVLLTMGLNRIRFMNLVCREVAGRTSRVQRKTGPLPQVDGPLVWSWYLGDCRMLCIGCRRNSVVLLHLDNLALKQPLTPALAGPGADTKSDGSATPPKVSGAPPQWAPHLCEFILSSNYR